MVLPVIRNAINISLPHVKTETEDKEAHDADQRQRSSSLWQAVVSWAGTEQAGQMMSWKALLIWWVPEVLGMHRQMWRSISSKVPWKVWERAYKLHSMYE